uniref:Ig-like domain-containing protein n=1 Tax=Ciona savignyi TaxID=51511 RepID=H2YI66_CIOSA
MNISCTSTGEPPADVTLFKNGEEIATESSGNFFLPFVTSDASGVYSCVATSVAGSAEDSISITVYTIPVVSIDERKVVVTSGDEMSVTCTANGNPEPSLSWSRLNGSLAEELVNTGKLSISNVKVD